MHRYFNFSNSSHVCSFSQHTRKSKEEIPGSRLLNEQSSRPQKDLNPAAGPVSATLYKEDKAEHCQEFSRLLLTN